MTTFQTFRRDLGLATAGLEQQAIAAQLAAFAHAEVEDAIRRGEASPSYRRFVNGQPDMPEERVTLPGPIDYVFSGWDQIIPFALDYLRGRSPVDSGDYQNSFVVIVNGRVVSRSSSGYQRRVLFGGQAGGGLDIPADALVTITNTQPYTRKIEVGAMRLSVQPRIFEDAEHEVASKFEGQVSTSTQYLRLHGGIADGVPYTLKGRQRQRAVAQTSRSSAFRAGRRALSDRGDSKAGQPLTYPSLVMTLG